MTPEGRVKEKVKSFLNTLQLHTSPVDCYYRMPVLFGYGKKTLDFEGCINGLLFSIETKAPGEWLTPLQRDIALEIMAGGGKVFVISGPDGLRAFAMWVCRCLTNSDRWVSTYIRTCTRPTMTSTAARRSRRNATPSSS